MNQPIDYITIIEPVLEATLTGTVDRYPWEQILHEQDIDLSGHGERLPILISVTEGEFKERSFRELSISIPLNQEEIFLVHAYNSRRFFALAERFFFRTPYYYAHVEIAAHRVALRQQGKQVFKASLPVYAEVLREEDECQHFKIRLPKALRKHRDKPHYFHAKLQGNTKHYASDEVAVTYPNSSPDAALTTLAESDFQVTDWLVRLDAKHSKSRTFEE